MENLSIGAISAWRQQQTAMQIGIAALKKSVDLQAEGALTLLQAVVETSPAAPTTGAPFDALVTAASSDSLVGRNIDVAV